MEWLSKNDKEYLRNLIEANSRNYPRLIRADMRSTINDVMKTFPTIKKISEVTYIMLHDMDGPPMCLCGKKLLQFNTYSLGYRSFCGLGCTARRENQSNKITKNYQELSDDDKIIRIEKQKETMLERYGVEHVMQVDKFKEKVKQTNLERYGVEHVAQSPEIRKKMEKTNIEKYGVAYPFQSNEIQQKSVETFKQNNPEQKSAMDMARNIYTERNSGINAFVIHRDKVLETLQNNYGVSHPSHSKELLQRVKETSLEKYGRPNHAQKHIGDEEWEVLSNKEKFIEQLNEYGAVGLSQKLNVVDGVIYRRMAEYGIETSRSLSEDAICNFVKSLGFAVKENDRTICKPREIDILVEEKKLCIEYCGLYWHSDTVLGDKNYHLNKLKQCNEKGYRLLTIFEDEWYYRPEVVKNKIRIALGVSNATIGARNLNVGLITNKEAREFLDKHHLQGGNLKASVYIGAFRGDKLVSVMVFGETGYKQREYDIFWDLKRFACDDGLYPGLASKMLKFFEDNFKPYAIISYADRRWSEGKVYDTLGFEMTNETPPTYWYIKQFERLHRKGFTKDKIRKKFNVSGEFNEKEKMKELGYNHIWDCGKLRYEKWYSK